MLVIQPLQLAHEAVCLLLDYPNGAYYGTTASRYGHMVDAIAKLVPHLPMSVVVSRWMAVDEGYEHSTDVS